ncbi:MAG TPA: hypothetical protein VMV69_05275, partial [Pirellulales bacterium]|nr:hypothetical protein [Pirellulales bacterium]
MLSWADPQSGFPKRCNSDVRGRRGPAAGPAGPAVPAGAAAGPADPAARVARASAGRVTISGRAD